VGKKPMARMAVSERAKQFMPFKAVLGLDEALERKSLELGIVERRELSEEELLDLNDKFKDVKVGDTVIVTYFTQQGYKSPCDIVRGIDLNSRYIKLGDKKISLDDITEIF